jgi:ABC-type multidrug transport system fused ATPase/permease subunit
MLFKQLTRIWRDNSIFLRELRHFPKLAVLAFTCSLLVSAFDGIGIGLLLSFLQSLTSPTAQSIKTGISWFDTQILGSDTTKNIQLLHISILILLVTWLRSGIAYLQALSTGKVEFNLLNRLRNKAFDQLSNLSLSYFSQTRSGELINSLTDEITRLRASFSSITSLISDGIRLTIYGFIICLISWQLSLIAILSLSLLSVGLSVLRKRVRLYSFAISQANSKLASISVEFLAGIFTVHAFGTQNFERSRFRQASFEVAKAEMQSLSKQSLIDPLGFAIGTTIVILIIVAGFIVLEVSVAQLLIFVYVLQSLVKIVQSMNGAATRISYFQGSLTSIKKLLSTDDKPYLQNGTVLFPGLKHSIQFASVYFGYEDNSRILSDINLTLNRGEVTALVGSSGAGKSTLAALIPRFYDPQRGQIFIDGVDLREFEIASLRQRIAVVSQDTFIFNTSIRNNIAYGTETADETAIYRVAQQSHALEFISNLPEGFDTQLGDRGVKLSGGQRQRIAIARALLRDPEILILDEATSALDSVSERLIQDSLEKLSIDRTVIAIAHRLSTIARAAKVVVLERGRVVEQGSYQELLDRKGKLWHYHQVQVAGSDL